MKLDLKKLAVLIAIVSMFWVVSVPAMAGEMAEVENKAAEDLVVEKTNEEMLLYITDTSKDKDNLEPIGDTLYICEGNAIALTLAVDENGVKRQLKQSDIKAADKIEWSARFSDAYEKGYTDDGVLERDVIHQPRTDEWDQPHDLTVWLEAKKQYEREITLKVSIYTPVENYFDNIGYTSLKIVVLPKGDTVSYNKVPEYSSQNPTMASNYQEAIEVVAQHILDRSDEIFYLPQTARMSDVYLDITDCCSEEYIIKPVYGDYLMDGITRLGYDVNPNAPTIYKVDQQLWPYKLKIEYDISKEQLKMVDEKIAEIVGEGGKLYSVRNESSRKKVNAIAAYIRAHVKSKMGYSGELHSIYGALIKHKASCDGISSLFYRLCRELDVPCRTIYSFTKSMHCYNIVQLEDGYWYYIDLANKKGIRDLKGSQRKAEQEKFQSSEFYYNYMSQLKNTTVDKKKVITLTENGQQVMTTDFITNIYNYIVRNDSTGKSYKITLNKNLKLRSFESSVLWMPGFDVTLDLNGKKLSYANNSFACQIALTKIENGTIVAGRNSSASVLFDDEEPSDTSIDVWPADCLAPGGVFYKNELLIRAPEESGKIILSNVNFKATDKNAGLNFRPDANYVIKDNCTIDKRFE